MTIFDSLFQFPKVRNQHNGAPLFKERAEYLTHAQAQGRKESYIKLMAAYLLQVNRTLGFSERMRAITIDELRSGGRRWEVYTGPLRRRKPGIQTYEVFMRVARGWLRFHSCLIEPAKTRFADKRRGEYERWLRDERGVSSATIKGRSQHAMYFLKWLAAYSVSLRHVSPSHVERYLGANKAKGLALSTQISRANSLRNFLRHSEARGSVRIGLSEAVPILVLPKHVFAERGPSWIGVRRMISSLSKVKPTGIRDYAMILLMALYGLRSGEIRRLRISDVDFKNHTLTVGRRKTRRTQRFPLTPEVSNALKKYINRTRHGSECPSLFLTTVTPCGPISHSCLYHRTSDLFRRTKVESLQKGPHAFRHACANQLMEKGASIQDIAAFLGHRHLRSVREYTRYKEKQLRQIAEFSLKGLL